MNFMQVQNSQNKSILLNLSTITMIAPKSAKQCVVYFYGEDYLTLNENYEDLVSNIESVQRRNGK